MDDPLLGALLWSVSVVPLILLTAALGYMYYKDRQKRKLMFALAIGISCFGYLYKMVYLGGGLSFMEPSFQWASLPMLSAVTIIAFSSFLKLKEFDKPFNLFLIPFGISIFLLFFSINEKTVFIALTCILSSISFVLLSKLVTTRPQRSDLMFLLALMFFTVSSIGLGLDVAPETTVSASFLGVWFTALMIATSKDNSEECMASFFVLKKEIVIAKRKFQVLFDSMPDPAVIVDAKGIFLEVSDRVKEISGYEKEELLGKNFFEINLVTAKSKELIMKNLTDRMMGLKKAPYEVEIISKDGQILIVELNAKLINYENEKVDLVIIRDRTESKKLEQALLESQEKFRAMTIFAKYAIVLMDKAGFIYYWNPAAEKIFGKTQEQTIGKEIFELLIPERFRYNFQRKFSNEFKKRGQGATLGESIETVSLRNDGTEFPIELSLSAFKVKDKWHMACIIQDITNRKNMQERLLKSERLAGIGELSTMVAHDLRNPLQGIKNATYYLKTSLSKKKMSKNESDMLGIINKNIKYSDKIINDLLDYSKDLTLETIPINSKLLVEESLSLIGIPKNIQIINEIPNELSIEADKDKMKRILANFFRNAIEAMPHGGKLEIKSQKSEENTQLIIKDTGVGIPKEYLEKLFAPFSTTKAKGMGLGLAICNRLVELHGGTISVESEFGKGTTFIVTLPSKPILDKDKMVFVASESLLMKISEGQTNIP